MSSNGWSTVRITVLTTVIAAGVTAANVASSVDAGATLPVVGLWVFWVAFAAVALTAPAMALRMAQLVGRRPLAWFSRAIAALTACVGVAVLSPGLVRIYRLLGYSEWWAVTLAVSVLVVLLATPVVLLMIMTSDEESAR